MFSLLPVKDDSLCRKNKRVVRTNINLAQTRHNVDIPKIDCVFLCIHKKHWKLFKMPLNI